MSDYILHMDDGTVLCHHGVKGQKWGIRRYQNEDGTLTKAGQKRYRKASLNENKNRRLLDSYKANRDYYKKGIEVGTHLSSRQIDKRTNKRIIRDFEDLTKYTDKIIKRLEKKLEESQMKVDQFRTPQTSVMIDEGRKTYQQISSTIREKEYETMLKDGFGYRK